MITEAMDFDATVSCKKISMKYDHNKKLITKRQRG